MTVNVRSAFRLSANVLNAYNLPSPEELPSGAFSESVLPRDESDDPVRARLVMNNSKKNFQSQIVCCRSAAAFKFELPGGPVSVRTPSRPC